MARKTTTRRKTGTTATRRRRTTTKRKNDNKIVNFFVPLFFICCILFCLGFLLLLGYKTATASSFFDVENVEMRGVVHIEKEKIKQIVRSHTLQNGVWHADIDAIKDEIEDFKFAKEVSVSRVLPDTVRVVVKERVPQAVVRLEGIDFWVDEEGLILNRVSDKEERPPFTMFGWDEQNTTEAKETNKKRVALYMKLLEDWRSYELAKRVKAVDLSDLRDPQAVVEDSGESVRILLSNEDYGKRLQKGIETVAGRGKEIKAIDMSSVNPIISYRNS